MTNGKDDLLLTTTQIGQWMGKSGQTIRNWTEEFSEFLSPLATAEGRHRVYNRDDLAVLVMVQEMRDSGFRPSEIGEALARGERGDVPDLDVQSVVTMDKDIAVKRLEVELDTTRRELEDTKTQLVEAMRELEESRAIREENIRLEARLEVLKEQYEAQISSIRDQFETTRQMYEGQMGQTASTYLDLLEKRQQEIREKDQQIIDLLRELGDQRERFGKYSSRDNEESRKRKDDD